MFLPTLTAFPLFHSALFRLLCFRSVQLFLRLQLAYIIESFFVQLSRYSSSVLPFPSFALRFRFLLRFSVSVPRRQFSSPSGSPAVLNPENDTELSLRSLDSFLLTLCVLVNSPLRCLTRSLSFCHLGMASFDELSFLLRFRSGFPRSLRSAFCSPFRSAFASLPGSLSASLLFSSFLFSSRFYPIPENDTSSRRLTVNRPLCFLLRGLFRLFGFCSFELLTAFAAIDLE